MQPFQRIAAIIATALTLITFGVVSQNAQADGSTWTIRTSPEANNWSGVAYGNGMFVAVSPIGTNRIMTSADGVTWTARTAPEANSWTSVTYGNGIFVAVAGFGTNRVMTSPDGITWTGISGITTNVSGVAFGGLAGNQLFVAVGMGDKVETSPDGVTWTQRNAASSSDWKSVTWGGNSFVAIAERGNNNKVMTSPDGITWTAPAGMTGMGWKGVGYGGAAGQEKFVLVGSPSETSNVMTSTDGATWTTQTASEPNAILKAVAYGNGKFIVLASAFSNAGAMTSTDGTNWTSLTIPEVNWNAITYANGIFVAVGTNKIMTSGTFTPEAAPTTTTPTTTPVTAVVPGVTVTDTTVYSKPPAEVAASSAITVLTPKQAKRLDITTTTPGVCLPNDDELVFIDTGSCIAEVVNAKTRKVLRTLKTTVIDDDVSELNVGNEIVVLAPIYFDSGSTAVNRKGLSTLRGLKDQISAAGSVLVVGHSGTRNGNSSTNIALSRERALSTVAALRAMKAKGPFSIASVGALDPVRKGTSESAQARNRRAVVVLIP